MDKKDVMIDLGGFSANQKLEGIKPIFKKIEESILNDNERDYAVVMIHADKNKSPNTSAFLAGDGEMTVATLNKTLIESIKAAADPHFVNKHLLENAACILLEVDPEKLDIGKEQKIKLEEITILLAAIALGGLV